LRISLAFGDYEKKILAARELGRPVLWWCEATQAALVSDRCGLGSSSFYNNSQKWK